MESNSSIRDNQLSEDEDKITTEQLILYVAGSPELEPEIRLRIATLQEDEGSRVRLWLDQFYEKCDSPFKVNWQELATDE